MELQTKRLKLVELTFADLEDIHKLHYLPEVDDVQYIRYSYDNSYYCHLLNEWLDQQQLTPRSSYIFCIKQFDTNCFVGLIALILGKVNFKIAEVWYKILPQYWRQGFTTEALTQLLYFGFTDLCLHRIEAGCAVENIASIKVLEKVGMTREGRKRKVLPIRGNWVDNYLYAILDTDF